MFSFRLLISFIFFIYLSDGIEVHWNYREFGPDVWKDLYPTCGSTSQSPINVKTECTIYQSFVPFKFSESYHSSQTFVLTNNGHTIIGAQQNTTAFPLLLSGGGLNETFFFKNFHLHWGENYRSGSEHQLNGQKFSGEVHFVHTNEAGTHNAVLAMFMQASAPESLSTNKTSQQRKEKQIYHTVNSTLTTWNEYFRKVENLERINNRTMMSLSLSSLMGTYLNRFYRYSGSLTTPPCTENVLWTIFETPIDFTDIDLENIRARIFYEDFRGPQFLYERTVYRNFPNATLSSIPDHTCCRSNTNTTPIVDGFSQGQSSNLCSNKQVFLYFYLIFYILKKNFDIYE